MSLTIIALTPVRKDGTPATSWSRVKAAAKAVETKKNNEMKQKVAEAAKAVTAEIQERRRIAEEARKAEAAKFCVLGERAATASKPSDKAALKAAKKANREFAVKNNGAASFAKVG